MEIAMVAATILGALVFTYYLLHDSKVEVVEEETMKVSSTVQPILYGATLLMIIAGDVTVLACVINEQMLLGAALFAGFSSMILGIYYMVKI